MADERKQSNIKRYYLLRISLDSINDNPKSSFQNADQFMLERVLPEGNHKMKPTTYVPLADGPPNYIGMRLPY